MVPVVVVILPFTILLTMNFFFSIYFPEVMNAFGRHIFKIFFWLFLTLKMLLLFLLFFVR